MTSTTIQRIAAGSSAVTTTKTREDKVGDLIVAMKPQMAAALPKHVNADRMARIVLTEFRRVPKLIEASRDSLLGAVMACSQLGLEPGMSLGHAYLLPFEKNFKDENGKWQKRTECQLIIGYRGMIDLARRSGQIVSLSARAVRAGDRFSYRYGLDETIDHVPAEGERGELTHVYAVAKLRDGGVQFEVMARAEIEKVRAVSKAKDNGPWVTHFEEMAKKTAIRRLFKYLPVSIEMQRAITMDEQADAGIPQEHNIIDMETGEYMGGAPVHEEGALITGPGNDAPANPKAVKGEPEGQTHATYAQLADDLLAVDKSAQEADAVLARARHLPEEQQQQLRTLAGGLSYE